MDRWLQTFFRTSIGTPNSLEVVTLHLPWIDEGRLGDECIALDILLPNATSISEAHLSIVFSMSPENANDMGDMLTAPGVAEEYIPNLMERGGFSLEGKCWGLYETVISLPRRQVGYSGCK